MTKKQRAYPKMCQVCTAFPEHKKNKVRKTLISLIKIGLSSHLPSKRKKEFERSKQEWPHLTGSVLYMGEKMNCHKKTLEEIHVRA